MSECEDYHTHYNDKRPLDDFHLSLPLGEFHKRPNDMLVADCASA